MCVGVPTRIAAHTKLVLSEGVVRVWRSFIARLVVQRTSLVAIHDSWSVSLAIYHFRPVWTIDGYLLVIDAEPVSMSVWIRKQSALQHLII